MLHFLAQPERGVIHVIEPLVAMRSAIVDALRHQGFSEVTGFADLKTMLDHLAVEPSDWILSASFSGSEINIFHLLKLCIDVPRIRNTRVSLLLRDHEKDYLPLAYELGLLSHHVTTIPSRIPDEFSELLGIARKSSFSDTLTSANYLRRTLKEIHRWDMIINFERTLLEIFPGSTNVLLSLAEAELGSGREEGKQILQQILLLDPDLKDEVDQIQRQYSGMENLDSPLEITMTSEAPPQALGISSCLLIDPDTTVHHSVRQALKAAGVTHVECFESGLSAWKWLKHGGHPSLILMEWRISELSGLQLLQRIRQHLPGVPIILVTSLITQSELPLLREMGVGGLAEKPFETHTLMSEIVTCLQQHRYPTEQSSMDRKFLECISLGQKAEACRLLAIYLSNTTYTEWGKLRLEAEFAFFMGQYQQTCSLAVEALKIATDSVELMNLVGKALMKLGDFENALRCLEKADTLAPRNLERICRLANLCNEMSQPEEARKWMNEAKSIDDDNLLVAEAEANIAIEQGLPEVAAEAMMKMENLHRIIAYTNNKAVAKIRNNQFEQGIQLYKTALEALPPVWSPIHDTVCFNLALAYIRFLEYPEAKIELNRIKAEPSGLMGLKVIALKSKIDHAIRTKTNLQFALEGGANNQAKPVTDTPFFELSQMIDSLSPVRGDICCYRAFFAQDMASEELHKLLLHMPAFITRLAVHKNESIPQRPVKTSAS